MSLPLTLCMVELYPNMATTLSALYLLRRNIQTLLTTRGESQERLAWSLGHKKSWINKFLNDQREIQLKDLDGIAEFFGVATYQLFQPGVSELTERRSGRERRSGKDRRISAQTRMARDLEKGIRRHIKEVPADPVTTQIRAIMEDTETRVSRVLSAANAGGQAATTRRALPAPRPRRRTASGSDVGKAGS